ncbi:MAG TPA: hypothetical protein DD490_21915 [Acidobacteria bacterium]|nr:hypothetical protein [Acidobacteriota bacterium]
MPHSQRIFFAYPHADRSFAERLARSLAQEGLDLVKVDASAGGLEEVDRQVRSADSVLLLINARSKFDEQQQRVWQAILAAAWENPKLRILPLLLRDAELPPFVRSAAAGREVQAIRIQSKSTLARVTAAILEQLLVKKSQPTPAAAAVTFRVPAKLLEIYSASPETVRIENRKRLSEMREHVEHLRH